MPSPALHSGSEGVGCCEVEIAQGHELVRGVYVGATCSRHYQNSPRSLMGRAIRGEGISGGGHNRILGDDLFVDRRQKSTYATEMAHES